MCIRDRYIDCICRYTRLSTGRHVRGTADGKADEEEDEEMEMSIYERNDLCEVDN